MASADVATAKAKATLINNLIIVSSDVISEAEARPTQMPQSPQQHLHRATARTTTDRFQMGLVESSYEIISGDKGRFPMGTPDPIVC